MGQAKQRGSRDDRISQAIERGNAIHQPAGGEDEVQAKLALLKTLNEEAARLVPLVNIPLKVDFEQREEVKALGARWDTGKKTWYIPISVDSAPLVGWMSASEEQDIPARLEAAQRAYKRLKEIDALKTEIRPNLSVHRSDNAEVKRLGARWDPHQRTWYVPPGKDVAPFYPWIKGNPNIVAVKRYGVVLSNSAGQKNKKYATLSQAYRAVDKHAMNEDHLGDDNYFFAIRDYGDTAGKEPIREWKSDVISYMWDALCEDLEAFLMYLDMSWHAPGASDMEAERVALRSYRPKKAKEIIALEDMLHARDREMKLLGVEEVFD